MNFKEKIYLIINRDKQGIKASRIYDSYMLIMILLSIIPLMFRTRYPIFKVIEIITVFSFLVDYILRWYVCELKLKKGWKSYLYYPFTPMAIIDLLSILPGLNLISDNFKLLRVTRLFKIAGLFRVFRYYDKVELLGKVFKKERNVLLTVLVIAIFYIFLTALVMFNAESRLNPVNGEETFHSFFDALYWSTVTLTTVGYGDLCPITPIGRIISMISSLFGVAIIALPSGVITASYLDELRHNKKISQANNP